MALLPPVNLPLLTNKHSSHSSNTSKMSSNRRISERRVAGLLGVAFDADDGHKRITRGKNFLLAGGSEQTHGMMRDTIVKMTERLDERGLDLTEVSVQELRDLLDEVQS